MWRLIVDGVLRFAIQVKSYIKQLFHKDVDLMFDSSVLRLISGAKGLSADTNTLHYLPFGTTTLKLRFDPPGDCPTGSFVATPRERHSDPMRVMVGHEDDGSDLWISWGGGKWEGIHFEPAEGQRYLYFNICHRGDLMADEYPVTIQVKSKEGQLVAERCFMLLRPHARQPIRLLWQNDWPFGSTLHWQGKQVASYQSRWWPEQRINYAEREIPPFRVRYDRLVTDNQWGRVTLSMVGEEAGASEQVLVRVDGRLESALHDVRLFHADLFHFHEDVWAVRLWFSWLHDRFTSDDIHPDLRGKTSPLVRDRKEEIPDAERFDILVDVKEKIVTHIGTDNHYKELWGEWGESDSPLQAYIGHNRSARTVLFILSARLSDTFASLSNSRDDDYNPVTLIREQLEDGAYRALSFSEIRDALSWEAHPPLVDDFRVPGELIGPDVRLVSQ